MTDNSSTKIRLISKKISPIHSPNRTTNKIVTKELTQIIDDSIRNNIVVRSVYIIKNLFKENKQKLKDIYYLYNINDLYNIDNQGSLLIEVKSTFLIILETILTDFKIQPIILDSYKDLYSIHNPQKLIDFKDKFFDQILSYVTENMNVYNNIYIQKRLSILNRLISQNKISIQKNICEYDSKGRVVKTNEELIYENVSIERVILNEDFLKNNDYLYIETLPLILLDFFDKYKNFAIQYVNVFNIPEDVAKEFDREIKKKIQQLDNIYTKLKILNESKSELVSKSKEDGTSLSNTNNQPKKKTLEEIKIEEKLVEIFMFYGNQHSNLPKDFTFEQWIDNKHLLYISDFIKFTTDFKIPIKVERIKKIFKLHSNGFTYIQFQQFYNLLVTISKILLEDKKDILIQDYNKLVQNYNKLPSELSKKLDKVEIEKKDLCIGYEQLKVKNKISEITFQLDILEKYTDDEKLNELFKLLGIYKNSYQYREKLSGFGVAYPTNDKTKKHGSNKKIFVECNKIGMKEKLAFRKMFKLNTQKSQEALKIESKKIISKLNLKKLEIASKEKKKDLNYRQIFDKPKKLKQYFKEINKINTIENSVKKAKDNIQNVQGDRSNLSIENNLQMNKMKALAPIIKKKAFFDEKEKININQFKQNYSWKDIESNNVNDKVIRKQLGEIITNTSNESNEEVINKLTKNKKLELPLIRSSSCQNYDTKLINLNKREERKNRDYFWMNEEEDLDQVNYKHEFI